MMTPRERLLQRVVSGRRHMHPLRLVLGEVLRQDPDGPTSDVYRQLQRDLASRDRYRAACEQLDRQERR